MAHFIISILCWLGLSAVLGKIAVNFEANSEKERKDFIYVILNGLAASIVFVLFLGILLAILSAIFPILNNFSEVFFDTLNPFGGSEEETTIRRF